MNSGTLRDRQILGNEGVVAAIVCIDFATGTVVGGPEVATRGWVAPDESADLFAGIADRVGKAVSAALAEGPSNPKAIEKVVRRAAGSFVGETTRRRPMIVPVVVEA